MNGTTGAAYSSWDRLRHEPRATTEWLAARLARFFCLMKNHNDEARWSQLMRQAQQGNETAYRELLTEISRSIRAALLRQFGNFPLIDDCVQESLLAIHNAKHSYQGSRPFKPWMNALVRHRTIDCLRRQSRHQQQLLDNQANLDLDSFQAHSNSSGQGVEDAIAGAQLLAALEQPNRDALIYTKLVGLSIDDTARKLDTTPAAVKQRVRRAMHKTRQLLEQSL